MRSAVKKIERLLGIETVHATGQPNTRTLCGIRLADSVNVLDSGDLTVREYYRRINCKRCLNAAVAQAFITQNLVNSFRQQ